MRPDTEGVFFEKKVTRGCDAPFIPYKEVNSLNKDQIKVATGNITADIEQVHKSLHKIR